MKENIRLDKFLADMNIGSRSYVKQCVKKRQIAVNGEIAVKAEQKVNIVKDCITWNGEIIGYEAIEYFMLNKPAGVVSATEDKHSKTVLDLIEDKSRKDLFPVGRLDKDTEGLLIITNDGMMTHRLLSPKNHIDKVYYVEVEGKLTEEDRIRFHEGLDIKDDKITMPAVLEILEAGVVSKAKVTLREGRYHQVKRMFEEVGKEVTFLKRISMGPITLDPSLAPGEYRTLTEEELELLLKLK